jgi:hypothetical protein
MTASRNGFSKMPGITALRYGNPVRKPPAELQNKRR